MFTESQLSFVTWVILFTLAIFVVVVIIYVIRKLLSGINWDRTSQSDTNSEITENPNVEFYRFINSHNLTPLIDADIVDCGICLIGEEFMQRLDPSAPLIPGEAAEELYDVLVKSYKKLEDHIKLVFITIPRLNYWQIVVKHVLPE